MMRKHSPSRYLLGLLLALVAVFAGGTTPALAAPTQMEDIWVRTYQRKVFEVEYGALADSSPSDYVSLSLVHSTGRSGTDDSFSGPLVALGGAEYTFESAGAGFSVFSTTPEGTRVYLGVGGDNVPNKTTASVIEALPRDDGSLALRGDDGVLAFWGSSVKKFGSFSDDNGGSDYGFYLFERVDNMTDPFGYGDPSNPSDPNESLVVETLGDVVSIPGYRQVASPESGHSYLVVNKHDDQFYVLNPSTDAVNPYSHVLRVDADSALDAPVDGARYFVVATGRDYEYDGYLYQHIGEKSFSLGGVEYMARNYVPLVYRHWDVTDVETDSYYGDLTQSANSRRIEKDGAPSSEVVPATSANNLAFSPADIEGYTMLGFFNHAQDGSGALNPITYEQDRYGEGTYYYVGDLYYGRDDQEFPLDSTTHTLDQDGNRYVFVGVTDPDGQPVSNSSVGSGDNAVPVLLPSDRLSIDGVKVWCIQPLVPTHDGARYDGEIDPDASLRAGLISLFSDDSSPLLHSLTAGLIWETMGYGHVVDGISKADPTYTNLLGLSAEERAQAEEYVNRIERQIDLYLNAETGFTSLTEGVSIQDGMLTINRFGGVNEIVLQAKTPELLALYAEYRLTCPEGISYSVDPDAGTLTLTGDFSKLASGSEVTMSVVPEGFPTESIKYTNRYGLQTLMLFGVPNPKSETLTLNIVDPTPVDVTLTAIKTLDGKEPKGSDFQFVLMDMEGNVIQSVRNNGGTVTFDTLTFAEPGVHRYKIAEAKGTDASVTYDDTEYTVVLEVNGESVLDATVTFFKDGVQVEGVPTFENATVPVVPYDPDEPKVPAKKKLPKAGDTTSQFVWVALGGTAAVAAGAVALRRMRKSK